MACLSQILGPETQEWCCEDESQRLQASCSHLYNKKKLKMEKHVNIQVKFIMYNRVILQLYLILIMIIGAETEIRMLSAVVTAISLTCNILSHFMDFTDGVVVSEHV